MILQGLSFWLYFVLFVIFFFLFLFLFCLFILFVGLFIWVKDPADLTCRWLGMWDVPPKHFNEITDKHQTQVQSPFFSKRIYGREFGELEPKVLLQPERLTLQIPFFATASHCHVASPCKPVPVQRKFLEPYKGISWC